MHAAPLVYEGKRMKNSASFLAVLLLSGVSVAAHAATFKSVGANPAILYDAPSDHARKVFVAPRGMPVEIILTQNGWSKVRDVAGDLSWVVAKDLTPKRTVIVTLAGARLRATADAHAAVIATIDKGVLLELAAPPAAGWVKLRHRDGQTGFLKVSEVWGE